MASSSYKALEKRQRDLLEGLVSRLQFSDRVASNNALKVFQQRIKYHRFLDTHPKDVEDLLKSVEDHLLLESQVSKRNALVRLKDEFLNVDWHKTHVGDIHHNVLRMLFFLARRPTESVVPPAPSLGNDPALEQCGGKESLEDVLSDWGDEVELCHSESELSDWSAFEDGQRAGDLRPTPLKDTKGDFQGGQVGLVAGGETKHNNLDSKLYIKHEELEELGNIPGSLYHSLSRSIFPKGQPFGIRITTEMTLVKECLRALQGIPGPVFRWSESVAEDARFVVEETLHIPHLSPASLRNLLLEFAQFATMVKSTNDWAEGVIRATSQLHCGMSLPEDVGMVFPTLAAFADALLTQLHKVIRPVIKFEQDLETNLGKEPSLVFLKVLMRGVGAKVSLLNLCRESVANVLTARPQTPRGGCKNVLDTIYFLLSEAEEVGDSSGYAEQHCLWQVFSGSLQPLLSNLTSWLFLGESAEISEEFFIYRNDDPEIQLSDFWLRGFLTDMDSVPFFLEELWLDIQEGGKALHILRSDEYEDRLQSKATGNCVEDRLADLVSHNWTSNLLHNDFLKYLGRVLQSPRSHDCIPENKSILQSMALAGFHRSCYELPKTESMVLPWEVDIAADSDDEDGLNREESFGWPVRLNSTEAIRHEDGVDAMETSGEDEQEADGGARLSVGNVSGDEVPEEEMEVECESQSEHNDLEVNHRERLRQLEILAEDIQQSTVTDTEAASERHGALARVCPFPTRLAAFDGSVLRAPYERPCTAESMRAIPVSCDTMPRLDLVLEEGFIAAMEERSREVVRSMLECLLEDLGMRHEFVLLQHIFCMRSAAMVEWVGKFCRKLNQDATVGSLREYEVVHDLQESFSTFAPRDKESYSDLFIQLQAGTSVGEMRSAGYMERSVSEIDMVEVHYPITWPLCVIFNHPRHAMFNQSLVFLMKLEWVSVTAEDAWSLLASCRRTDWVDLVGRTRGISSRLKGWHHVQSCLSEILHITRSLKKCIAWRFDRLIAKFEKGLDSVDSVGRLQSIQDEMIKEVKGACFGTDGPQWKKCNQHLSEFLNHSLNLATMVCAMDKDGVKPSSLAVAMEARFPAYEKARHEFLTFLQMYNASLGGDPELEIMIFVINFNEFYPKYNMLKSREDILKEKYGKYYGQDRDRDLATGKRSKKQSLAPW
ncbi:hypothetical protein BSKO_00483 [Bryopsis sp. KO-2023]|nr:hypothetical protein BSKO_00483 [Bryopsis sp. KO-2023]